ncbi:hypothetical protein Tcan_11374 [Toxocara canis]|uniref:Uncharacterized protein n=1 Tax=Toxocara canis TaxID=6265 RepID=A0A0B2VMF7_TOXCA|nr:hypothetical protein Tcan_11374 [Toxocara canis]
MLSRERKAIDEIRQVAPFRLPTARIRAARYILSRLANVGDMNGAAGADV